MPIETSAPHFDTLIAGHFREDAHYVNWRGQGTNDWLLIYTVAGAGRFGGANALTHQTRRGDIVLIHPNTPHDYGTYPIALAPALAPHWELLWAHFHARPHWQERGLLRWPALWPDTPTGVTHLELAEGAVCERVEASLRAMVQATTGGQKRRDEFAMNALEAALLWCDTVNPDAPGAGRDARVTQAIEFLCRNLSDGELGLAQVAQACHCSVSRLAHLFRAQVGITPQQYLERERLERAQSLLALTNRSVQAVAEEVGYQSAFYFSARFKRQTGLSPRDWRNRIHRDTGGDTIPS